MTVKLFLVVLTTVMSAQTRTKSAVLWVQVIAHAAIDVN
jgi:hypothetical protein